MLGNILFRQALSIRLEHRPPSAGGFAHELAQIETVRDFSTSATLSACPTCRLCCCSSA